MKFVKIIFRTSFPYESIKAYIIHFLSALCWCKLTTLQLINWFKGLKNSWIYLYKQMDLFKYSKKLRVNLSIKLFFINVDILTQANVRCCSWLPRNKLNGCIRNTAAVCANVATVTSYWIRWYDVTVATLPNTAVVILVTFTSVQTVPKVSCQSQIDAYHH